MSSNEVEGYLISGTSWIEFFDDHSTVMEYIFYDDGTGKSKPLAFEKSDVPKSYDKYSEFEWKVDGKLLVISGYGNDYTIKYVDKILFADENEIILQGDDIVGERSILLRNSGENGRLNKKWELFYANKKHYLNGGTKSTTEESNTELTVPSSDQYPEKLLSDLINRLSGIRIEEKRKEGNINIIVKETGLKINKDGSFKYFQKERPMDGVGGIMYRMEGNISLIPGTYNKEINNLEDQYGDVLGTEYDYNCYIMLNNNLTSSGELPKKVAIGISWHKMNDDNPKITTNTKICVAGLNASANSRLGADPQDEIAPILGCYD
ncbi:MAG: hypothetical protein KDE33_14745 [Bacteroidetes bacterium]|nr:hypothetical protein [Bacteroidota bacterium]